MVEGQPSQGHGRVRRDRLHPHRLQQDRGAGGCLGAQCRDQCRDLHPGPVRPSRPAAGHAARRRWCRLQPVHDRTRRRARHAQGLLDHRGRRHARDHQVGKDLQVAPGKPSQDPRTASPRLPHLPAARRLQPHHLFLRQSAGDALLRHLPDLRAAQDRRFRRHPRHHAGLQAGQPAGDQGRTLLRPRLQPVHRLPALPDRLQRHPRRRLPGSQGSRDAAGQAHLRRHHRRNPGRFRLQVLPGLRHRLSDRCADRPHARSRQARGVDGALQERLPGGHRRAALRAARRRGQVRRGDRRGAREAALPGHRRPRLLRHVRGGLPPRQAR